MKKTRPVPLSANLSIFILLIAIFLWGCNHTEHPERKKAAEWADYVNPFIGTYKEGHTFPGACLPFGMVQLSPDNGYKGVRAYNYAEPAILGFSHAQRKILYQNLDHPRRHCRRRSPGLRNGPRTQ